ncbi:MAG: cytochrome b/b6 domain-containing protein [Burkholderiales bacterium]|nr:cytochrome b/b6 domain-containing protein [Burkholderiales bacterium]MDP2398427.1 cytochrome b/b6 domain-containing protein [Burkholderiales bacterium]
MAQMQEDGGRQPVLVWDVAVRVFHWMLVLLLGFSWLSAEMDWMDWHFYSGYAALTLILFRILWGFVGSTHARFGDFLYGPSAIIAYLRTLPSRTAAKFAGHNPLGGISVVLILLCVLVQAGTGLFANDDILYEGPLYKHVSKDLSDWLTTIHKYNFDVLLVLASVHVAAVLYYLFWKSENLIKPMFTGRKQLPQGVVPAHVQIRSLGLAATLLAFCAAVVWFLVNS